jgi:hypothetical protein
MMTMTQEQLDFYWMIQRRRPATLSRWYHSLNNWQWPKECGEGEPRGANVPTPRRQAFMALIERELGRRALRELRKGGAEQ